jgi:hypothetical protein
MVKKLVPVSALSNNSLRQRPSMINEAREVLCQGRFPASLIDVLIVSPSPAVPSTFRPLPSRNTSAGRPVVPGTALLPLSFLPWSEKETICDSPCPDGSALHGNAANIDARLAAARTLQPGWFRGNRLFSSAMEFWRGTGRQSRSLSCYRWQKHCRASRYPRKRMLGSFIEPLIPSDWSDAT